jgi:enterobactin synthetase component D
MGFIKLEQHHTVQPNQYSNGNYVNISEPGPIHIYSCEFDIKQYRQYLYGELGIYFPVELKRAVKKRQAEFLAGRYTAKQSIRHSGLLNNTSPTIGIGKHRSPIWPTGIKGSITHHHAAAASAITIDNNENCIGIDLEQYFTTKTAIELENTILTPLEKSILIKKNISEHVAITLSFSAKESLFKALYPKVGQYFGFEMASIEAIDTRKCCLTISLSKHFAKQYNLKNRYICHYKFEKDFLFTMVK